ncbi:MAG: alpha/beta hydrolase [Sphingomonadales bacterium]|nr:alpha/beta hydrolase [Sphingomonadales bacterium]
MTEYHLHGHGPARAIVLSGWIGDWRVFEPMLDAIDEQRLSLAFMDNRGYGVARDSDGPYDMATIAADARALADRLGWEWFSVIGHSMGGKAALRLAIDIPDRVERIVGITPVWAGAAPLDPDLVAICRGAAEDVSLRELLVRVTTGEALSPRWSQRIAEASAQVCRKDAYAAYFEAWAFNDFADEARGLPHPTLVIAGGSDNGVPEAGIEATWLAELPRATLHRLPHAGHYPMQECPPLLARIIEDFLA